MSGSIPNEFIDQLLNTVDIVDVVGRHVRLKKAGKEFTGLCPFHNEKTPSFTVSPSKQFFHCFGCGAHGSAIGFLMQHENLAFVDAVEDLAHAAHLQVPRSGNSAPRKNLDPLFEVSREAAAYYYRNLNSLAPDSAAKQYIMARGINAATIKRFGIGFAPDDWHGLLDNIGHEQKENLSKAGLIISNEKGNQYDRFRNRLVFPIRDRKGRVIAFGGRVLDKSTPKYLNSPESPIFHKGRELYGLYELLQSSPKPEYILVTEGYMDVVSLSQFGIVNAVATLGTAMTSDHGKRMSRLTDQIVFCFDGDRAGQAAAWRALENMLPILRPELSVRFLMLPEGEDPDSLVKKEGQSAFEQRVKNAQSLPEFISSRLIAKYDRNSLEGRAHLLAAAEPLLATIEDSSYKTILTEHIASLANTSAERMMQRPAPAPSRNREQQMQKPRRPVDGNLLTRTPIRVAIALLIQKPELAVKHAPFHKLDKANDHGVEVLMQVADYILSNPDATAGTILEHWREHPYGKSLAKLAAWEHLVPENGYDQEFSDALNRLQNLQVSQRLDLLQTKLEENGLDDHDKQEYRQLLQTRSGLS